MNKKTKYKLEALGVVLILFLVVVCLKWEYNVDNKALQEKVLYYELALKNLKEEIEGISPYYDFKIDGYDHQIAKVVNRNIYDLSDNIIINIGSSDGVNTGMPVINSEGLVGIVGTVKETFSYVNLLTDPDTVVSVKINNSFGIYKKNLVEKLKYEDNVTEGDIVFTSGLTNVPANIPIGKVENVSSDKKQIEKTAKIDLLFNIRDLDFVIVIKSGVFK